MTENKSQLGGGRAWLMMIIVWIASIMAPLAQFKVTPLASYLAQYGFDMSNFGLLMSWMSIIGIILAFPAAFITGKLGPKKSILLCLVFIIVGTAIGAFAPNMQVLLGSRVCEGVGLGIMGITAPSAIAVWFPPAKRGFPLGLWSAWVPVGIVTAFNTAPRIAAATGNFRVVWYCALALTIVVAILFAIIYKLPEGVSDKDFAVQGTPKEAVKLAATGNIWILALAFFSFHTVGTVTLNTYYPSFLQGTYDMTPVQSSQLTSYHTMLCIITNPLGGILYDKTRRPKLLISLGLIILIICAAISWTQVLAVNVLFIVCSAFGIGLIAGCCRAFSTELLADKNPLMAAPVSQAVLTFGQRCCDCFAPMAYGAILAGGTVWTHTNYFTIPVLLVSLLLIAFALRHKDGSAPKAI